MQRRERARTHIIRPSRGCTAGRARPGIGFELGARARGERKNGPGDRARTVRQEWMDSRAGPSPPVCVVCSKEALAVLLIWESLQLRRFSPRVLVGCKQVEFYMEEREKGKRRKPALLLHPAKTGRTISVCGPRHRQPHAPHLQWVQRRRMHEDAAGHAGWLISPALKSPLEHG